MENTKTETEKQKEIDEQLKQLDTTMHEQVAKIQKQRDELYEEQKYIKEDFYKKKRKLMNEYAASIEVKN